MIQGQTSPVVHLKRLIMGRKSQKGFALIEVLVTVVVMAIALLGLAGLQTLSMQNNQGAYLRTQATILAYDMIEKMRANKDEALGGSYEIDYGDAPSGTSNCDSAACTATNITEFDTNLWKCLLGNWDTNSVCSTTLGVTGYLPDGDGEIEQNGDIYTVSIRWTERDGSQTEFEVSTEI